MARLIFDAVCKWNGIPSNWNALFYVEKFLSLIDFSALTAHVQSTRQFTWAGSTSNNNLNITLEAGAMPLWVLRSTDAFFVSVIWSSCSYSMNGHQKHFPNNSMCLCVIALLATQVVRQKLSPMQRQNLCLFVIQRRSCLPNPWSGLLYLEISGNEKMDCTLQGIIRQHSFFCNSGLAFDYLKMDVRIMHRSRLIAPKGASPLWSPESESRPLIHSQNWKCFKLEVCF